MTASDIQAGKAGFQKADLMDYGSLYGMGSYFGEDYTATNLVRLATLTQDNYRAVDDRQGAVTIDGGAAGLDQGRDAGGIAGHRPDPTRGRDSAAGCCGDHHAAEADRTVLVAS